MRATFLFLSLLARASPQILARNVTWTSGGSDVGWSPRAGTYFVVPWIPAGEALIIGGHNSTSLYGFDGGGGGAFSDVWASSESLSSWRELNASAPWGPRAGSAAAARIKSDGTALALLIGGFVAPGAGSPASSAPLSSLALFGDVWWTNDGGNWTRVDASMPWGPRYGHALTHGNSRGSNAFWLLGGAVGSSIDDAKAVADVWMSMDGLAWKSVSANTTAMYSPPRIFFAAAAFSTRLWVAGGVTDAGVLLRDLWMSDPGGASWFAVPGVGGGSWSPRAGALLWPTQTPNTRLWLLGGQESEVSLPSMSAVPPIPRLAGDAWRSDISGASGWELVENATEFGGQPRGWSGRAMIGGVQNYNGPQFGPGFVGGLSAAFSGAPATPAADVWIPLLNIECESRNEVCSRHGICSNLFSGGALGFSFFCQCDAQWLGSSCGTKRSCDNRVCGVHGMCTPSVPGDVNDTCKCLDSKSWALDPTGQSCSVPICASGCNTPFGSCADAPGTCTCVPGRVGSLCEFSENELHEAGRFITDHLTEIFSATFVVGIVALVFLSAWANAIAMTPLHQRKQVRLVTALETMKSLWFDDSSALSVDDAWVPKRHPVFGSLRARFGGRNNADPKSGESTALLRDAVAPDSSASFESFQSRHGGAVAFSPMSSSKAAVPGSPSAANRDVGVGALPVKKTRLRWNEELADVRTYVKGSSLRDDDN